MVDIEYKKKEIKQLKRYNKSSNMIANVAVIAAGIAGTVGIMTGAWLPVGVAVAGSLGFLAYESFASTSREEKIKDLEQEIAPKEFEINQLKKTRKNFALAPQEKPEMLTTETPTNKSEEVMKQLDSIPLRTVTDRKCGINKSQTRTPKKRRPVKKKELAGSV